MARFAMTRHAWTLLLFVILTSGCGSPEGRLIGRWQGRPETAADRAGGDSKADNQADPADASRPPSERPSPSETGDASSKQPTLFEAFDFTILLDFVDASHLVMSMTRDGRTEQKTARWKVVNSADPQELTIEITLADATNSSETPPPTAVETRLLTLRFPPDNFDQFTLQEVGADEDLGSLLFKRASAE